MRCFGHALTFALALWLIPPGCVPLPDDPGSGQQNSGWTPSSHQPLEQTLLAATVQRIVIARAEYSQDVSQTETLVHPSRLNVAAIDPTTGNVTSLDNLFAGRMLDVPVTDGDWLAAIDSAGTAWLADLNTSVTQQLPLGDASATTQPSLWALHEPWLVGSDSSGTFAYNFLSGARVELPAGAHPTPVAVGPTHVAYLREPASADSAGLLDLQLMDLNSGTITTLASLKTAQLFMLDSQFSYIEFSESEQVWYVRAISLTTGAASTRLRLRLVPSDGETQSIADIGVRGYLLQHRSRSSTGILFEELEVLRSTGDRDFIAIYGLIGNPTGLGRPCFAADLLIFEDPNDGFWVINDLNTAASRRVNPFPNS